jgi:hypothetical protein
MAGSTVRTRFADPFPVFNPQGNEAAETTAICTLTLVCTQHDTHPSDAGYQTLASLIWNASGYHSRGADIAMDQAPRECNFNGVTQSNRGDTE